MFASCSDYNDFEEFLCPNIAPSAETFLRTAFAYAAAMTPILMVIYPLVQATPSKKSGAANCF